MANSVLGTYIDRNAKSNTRSWRGFGRKMSSRRYRLEKAQEAAIGEGHLAEIIGGYLRGNPEWPEEKRRNIPDCLDICGPVVHRQLGCSRVVWHTPEEFATSPRWLPNLLQPGSHEKDP
jgi:hypothetical protein